MFFPGITSFLKMCCSSSKTLFISRWTCASILIFFQTIPSLLLIGTRDFQCEILSRGRGHGGLDWSISLSSYLVHSHFCPDSHTSSSTRLHSLSQILTTNKMVNENQLHEDSGTISDASLFPITLSISWAALPPAAILISQTISTDNFM